mmetsp:Transcript_96260/g.310804  ORF Transcript_96260/g.310804 Transcript_96260/m.310804 type:complete len:282 (-) Transcript_96260:104-949(-)
MELCSTCKCWIHAADAASHAHCSYCRRVVHTDQRVLHEEGCCKNRELCRVCKCWFQARDFRSHKHCTYCCRKVALDQKEDHEAQCPKNQALCQICGKAFQVQALRSHQHCIYCHEVVDPDLKLEHELKCKADRECAHCHRVVDPEEKLGHEASCPDNRARCQTCSSWFQAQECARHKCNKEAGPHAKAGAAGSRFSFCPEGRGVPPRQLGQPTQLPAEAEAAAAQEVDRIRQELGSVAGRERKARLRRLQLEWHPDKAKGDTAVAHLVFCFIQDQWERRCK